MGQTYAWSVFVKPLAEHFHWSLADTMVAFAIYHTFSTLPLFIAAKAQERWNIHPRTIVLLGGVVLGLSTLGVGFATNLTTLYIAYGFMGGGGFGLIYSAVLPAMVKFFPDRRGLASGFLVAGIGAAPLIWAPIGVYLIEHYGVLSTFKILGVLNLVVFCVLGFFVQPPPVGFTPAGWVPSKIQQQNLAVVDKNWLGMLCDPLYYCISLGIGMGALSGLMITAAASPILQSVGGYTAAVASYWVGILAVCNLAGRLGWGWISDRVGRMPSLITIYAILGCAMLWMAFTDYRVVVPLLLVGMCFGGFMGMPGSLTADAFGTKYLTFNFVVLFCPFAVGAFIGPRLGPAIKESTGSYSEAFLYGGILAFIAVVLAIIAALIMRQRRKRYLAEKAISAA